MSVMELHPLWVTLMGMAVTGSILWLMGQWITRKVRLARTERLVWLAVVVGMGVVGWGELLGVRGMVSSEWTRWAGRAQEVQGSGSVTDGASRSSGPRESGVTVVVTARPLEATEGRARGGAEWVAMVWMVGTVVVMARCGLALAMLPWMRRRLRPITDSGILAAGRDVARQLGLGQLPEMRTGSLLSPLTYGMVRPVVCLPEDFGVVFSEESQRAVLAHELAHVAARDAVWRCGVEWMVAVWWWHPAAWTIRRRWHAACELAADEASRRVVPASESLAEALVSLASRSGPRTPWPLMAASGDGCPSDLGRRVERLLGDACEVPRVPSAGWRWALGALGLAMVGLVLASGCRSGERAPWRLAGETLQEEPAHESAGVKEEGREDWKTLTYRLDQRAVLQNLETLGARPGETDVAGVLRRRVEELLGDRPPPVIMYNAHNGMLLVRADSEARNVLDDLVTTLNQVPAIIQIQSVWMLATEEAVNDLFREWPGLRPRRVESAAVSNVMVSASLTELVGNYPNVRLETEGSSTAVTLNRSQARRIQEWARGREGVRVQASPRVTTLDGRQAQVQVVDLRTLVTGVSTNAQGVNYLTTQVPLGPVLDVVPVVQADRLNIGMTVISTMNEFVGYDDPGVFMVTSVTSSASGGVGGPLTATLPLPRLRVHQMQARAVVMDGDSLLLGGDLLEVWAKEPGAVEEGGAVGGAGAGGPGSHQLVLITPTLVDAVGNPVHFDLE